MCGVGERITIHFPCYPMFVILSQIILNELIFTGKHYTFVSNRNSIVIFAANLLRDDGGLDATLSPLFRNLCTLSTYHTKTYLTMKKLLLLFFAVLLSGTVQAGTQTAKVQALFIFQFAKYTGWPKEDAGKPFVISIVGDEDVADELRKATQGKSVGGRGIDVVSVASVSSLPTSDIIFLGDGMSGWMNKVANDQADRHVLIIGGTSGLCSHGASVTFVSGGNKLTFEISERNMARHGLHMAPKLVAMGTPVP